MTQVVSLRAHVPWPGLCGAVTLGTEEVGDVGFELRSYSREAVFTLESTNTESEMKAWGRGDWDHCELKQSSWRRRT